MKRLKCVTLCLPFLVSLHIYAPTRPISPQNERQQYWLLHARLTTDEIVQEALALAIVDRSIAFGRLATIWWRDDQKQSRAWLKKAIDELEVEPESKLGNE